MQERREDRSLGELFTDLSRQTTSLVRQEVALAKTEMSAKVSQLGKNIGLLVVGGLIAYAGVLGIGAGIILLLGTLGMTWWVSALLVGLSVALIGYILIQRGRDALAQADLVPHQTLETLKEDAEMLKEQSR